MKHEKNLVHTFHPSSLQPTRTKSIQGHGYVQHTEKVASSISSAHGYGTPIRTVKSKHEEIHGAKGMESHGALHSSHPSHHGKMSTFGKDNGHANMKSDLGHNAYRPTC